MTNAFSGSTNVAVAVLVSWFPEGEHILTPTKNTLKDPLVGLRKHTFVYKWQSAVLVRAVGPGVAARRVQVDHEVRLLPAVLLQRAAQLLVAPHRLQHQAGAAHLPLRTVPGGDRGAGSAMYLHLHRGYLPDAFTKATHNYKYICRKRDSERNQYIAGGT